VKSGFVAILGRPNAGKSTFLNAFISKKVSIVTQKAQTTRDSIIGIYHEKEAEISFIDTPGLFDPKEALDKEMVKTARSASKDVDVALYIVDVSRKEWDEEKKTIDSLHIKSPLIIALNKIDLIKIDEGKAALEVFSTYYPEAEIIEMSALDNFGLKECKERIISHLSVGPSFFEEDRFTDKDKPFMAKEVIREEILHFLNEEVPHQAAVEILSFEEKGDSVKIEAKIFVEKLSHKAIVIGKGGEMIKKISMSARRELERLWKNHVTLYVEVAYEPNWRNSIAKLRKLGYGQSDK